MSTSFSLPRAALSNMDAILYALRDTSETSPLSSREIRERSGVNKETTTRLLKRITHERQASRARLENISQVRYHYYLDDKQKEKAEQRLSKVEASLAESSATLESAIHLQAIEKEEEQKRFALIERVTQYKKAREEYSELMQEIAERQAMTKKLEKENAQLRRALKNADKLRADAQKEFEELESLRRNTINYSFMSEAITEFSGLVRFVENLCDREVFRDDMRLKTIRGHYQSALMRMRSIE